MREHPILFSAEMIRALLAGRKSVTRRMSKSWLKVKAGDRLWVRECYGIGGARLVDPCLNFRADGAQANLFPVKPGWWRRSEEAFGVASDADLLNIREGWIPSIHMPRWASRIILEALEDARMERLHDITEEDAIREGVGDLSYPAVLARALGPGEFTAKFVFRRLWSTLHADPGERWSDNPEVVRVGEFRRLP